MDIQLVSFLETFGLHVVLSERALQSDVCCEKLMNADVRGTASTAQYALHPCLSTPLMLKQEVDLGYWLANTAIGLHLTLVLNFRGQTTSSDSC